MSRPKKWKEREDPLYRGAFEDTPGTPVPNASPSIVRHVLYLEGFGRETPYLSTSESYDAAEHFAQEHDGAVWKTDVPGALSHGVKHLSHKELLTLLKGVGKGDAAWSSAHEVLRARAYVEQHLEHLLDFRAHEPHSVDATVRAVFERVP